MAVQKQGEATQVRVDDVVLLAGDEPQLLARDAALLQRRQVRVRPQPLLHRFELLTDLGDERSSVRHGGHGGGEADRLSIAHSSHRKRTPRRLVLCGGLLPA